GGVSIVTQELAAFAKYSYDGLGKRIRLTEIGSYANATFQLDVLLLFKQGFMYKINNKDRTCFKKHLMEDFHPLAIPNDASLVGQAVLGSTSVQGEGLLVNTWTAKYLSTVTEFGCFPVNTLVNLSVPFPFLESLPQAEQNDVAYNMKQLRKWAFLTKKPLLPRKSKNLFKQILQQIT
uniref:Uncharacterized protein n=1 Tax=Oryzias sinensis TaxID=183150 RepID=A0A8C7Y9H1_9TELE